MIKPPTVASRIAATVYRQMPAFKRADPVDARRFIYLSITSWRPDIPRKDAAIAAAAAVLRQRSLKADFKEAEHPRAPEGTEEGGQFVKKEGGAEGLHTNREANAARNWSRDARFGHGFDDLWRDSLKDVLKIKSGEQAEKYAADQRANAQAARESSAATAGRIKALRARLAEPDLDLQAKHDALRSLGFETDELLHRHQAANAAAAAAELGDWRRETLKGLADGKAAKKALRRKVEGEPAFDLPLTTADAHAIFSDMDPELDVLRRRVEAQKAAGTVLGWAPDAIDADDEAAIDKAEAAGEISRLPRMAHVSTSLQHVVRKHAEALDDQIKAYQKAYRAWRFPPDDDRAKGRGPPPPIPDAIKDALDPANPERLQDAWPAYMVGFSYDDKFTPGQKEAAWRMLAGASPEIKRLKEGMDELQQRANAANRTMFEKSPSFFRGMRMSEASNMLSTGTTGTRIAQNGGNDMLSLTSDASEAFTFTMTDDKSDEQGRHGLAIMAEFDGDKIRSGGGAPVEYSYTAQDGPGRERFGKPITLIHEYQHETRIKKFTPLDKAGLKRFIVGVDRRQEGMTKEAVALIRKMAEHADVLLYDRNRLDILRGNHSRGTPEHEREMFEWYDRRAGAEDEAVPADRRRIVEDLGALKGAVPPPLPPPPAADPLLTLWRRAREASSSPDRTAETLAGWLAKWYYDGDLAAARRAVRRLRVGRLRGLLAAYRESEHPRDEKGRWAETEGRRSTPDELRKRIGKLRTDLRRLRKDAGATPEAEADLANRIAAARRALSTSLHESMGLGSGGGSANDRADKYDADGPRDSVIDVPPPAVPRPEQAGTIYGTAGKLRPVQRGASRAAEESGIRAYRQSRRAAEHLVDWEKVQASLGRGLSRAQKKRIAAEIDAKPHSGDVVGAQAELFLEAFNPHLRGPLRLAIFEQIRSTKAYQEAPAGATRTAEAEHKHAEAAATRVLAVEAQKAFEGATVFWRGTAAREAHNMLATGHWGRPDDEKHSPSELEDLGPTFSGNNVSTSTLPVLAGEYMGDGESGFLLIEIEADSMRAARGKGSVRTSQDEHAANPDGDWEESPAYEMGVQMESRIEHGTPIDQVRPAAFHVTRDTLRIFKQMGTDLGQLAKIAPIVVHGREIPAGLDPTASSAAKPKSRVRRRRSTRRRPLKGAAAGDTDGRSAAGLARLVTNRFMRAGMLPSPAALTRIIRQWRPDLPASEIVRALGGTPGDLRRDKHRRQIRQAVDRVLAGKGAAEILPGLWSVATENGNAIVMASSAKEALRSAGGPGARVASLRARLRLLAAAWDESKHPRGQPENKGQFAETEGAETEAAGARRAKGDKKQARPRQRRRRRAEAAEAAGDDPAAGFETSTPFAVMLDDGRIPIEIDEDAARDLAPVVGVVKHVWNTLPERLRHVASWGLHVSARIDGSDSVLGRAGAKQPIELAAATLAEYVLERLDEGGDAHAAVAWTMIHEIGHQMFAMPGLLTNEEKAEFVEAVLLAKSPLTDYVGQYTPPDLRKLRAELEAGGTRRALVMGEVLSNIKERSNEYSAHQQYGYIQESWAEATAMYFAADANTAGLDPESLLAKRKIEGVPKTTWKRLRPVFDKIIQRLESDDWGVIGYMEGINDLSELKGAALNAAARVQLVPALNKERQKYRVDWRENARRGKKADLFIKTFLIDDTRNRNGWRASWPSIKRLHKTFRGRPGIVFWSCGRKGCLRDHTEEQTYEANVRRQEKYRVSTIIDTVLDESTHTAYAIHHVEREDFAQQVRQGVVKFLSPSIWPDREKTTVRLADPDGTAGESDLAREWHIDTTGWKGLHDAWVDIPAYGPKARVVATCEGRKDCAAELRKPQSYGTYGTLAARLRSIRARLPALRAAFDESKHPRGQPDNAGQFVEKGRGRGRGRGGGSGRGDAKGPRAGAPPIPVSSSDYPADEDGAARDNSRSFRSMMIGMKHGVASPERLAYNAATFQTTPAFWRGISMGAVRNMLRTGQYGMTAQTTAEEERAHNWGQKGRLHRGTKVDDSDRTVSLGMAAHTGATYARKLHDSPGGIESASVVLEIDGDGVRSLPREAVMHADDVEGDQKVRELMASIGEVRLSRRVRLADAPIRAVHAYEDDLPSDDDLRALRGAGIPVYLHKYDVMANTTITPTLAAAASKSLRGAAYEEAKHPRDEKGRWAETESRGRGGGTEGGMDDGLSPADRAARTMHRAERVFKSVRRRSFDGENPGWPLVRPEKDSANRHFEAAAREDAVVVTQMNPRDYLRLAAGLTHPVPEKIERFKKRLEAGEEIDTPYLILAEDDKHGLPQVTGHEGRHRARAAIEAGVASMPVYLYSFQPFSEDVREDLWAANIENIADEMRGQDSPARR